MTVTTEAPATAEPARFTARHRDLTEALKIVALAIPKFSNIPAQHSVLVEASRSTLTLRTFDFETALSVRVDVEPGSNGRSLVNFFDLKDTLAAAVAGEKAADAARTPVTLDDGVLSTPDLAVPVNLHDTAEYTAPPAEAGPAVTVDGAEFFAALARVLPAAAHDDTLPTLCAVHMRLSGASLRMTATDRYRIAVADLDVQPCDGEEVAEATVKVSAEVLMKLATRLGKYTGPISLGIHAAEYGTRATLGIGPVTADLRGIDGDYPEIWNLIPGEATAGAVTLNRAAIIRAAKKAHALAQAKKTKVGKTSLVPAVGFTFEGGMVSLAPNLSTDEQTKTRGVSVAAPAVPGRPRPRRAAPADAGGRGLPARRPRLLHRRHGDPAPAHRDEADAADRRRGRGRCRIPAPAHAGAPEGVALPQPGADTAPGLPADQGRRNRSCDTCCGPPPT